jgi:catechol 2,3-dioxygenase-like lactoylglutathione lyase family enzyme
MLAQSKAFSGMAVRDIDAARRFYGETLGIEVEVLDEQNGLLSLKHGDGRETLLYGKPDHTPSNNTVLNFPVDDIDAVVDDLSARGVEFERYDEFPPDEKGIMRGRAAGRGPDIAWFKDPGGNILSVLQES